MRRCLPAVLFALLCAFALPASAQQSDPKNILESQTLYRKGLEAERNSELEKAKDFYFEAISLDRNNVRAHTRYQRLFLCDGKDDRLHEQLERFYSANYDQLKGEAKYNYVFGHALALIGKPESARKRFNVALEQDPNCYQATEGLARLEAAAGRFPEAMELFAGALKINPRDYDAHLNRAAAMLEQARKIARGLPDKSKELLELALKDLNECIDVDPTDPIAWEYRAGVNGALDKNEDALRDLNRVIELNPKRAEPLLKRGEYYLRCKRVEAALQDFTQALSHTPTHVGALCARGQLYLALKKNEEARADFDMAVRMNPQDYRGYLGRARLWEDIANPEEALKDYTKTLDTAPKPVHAQIYADRGALLARMGRNEESVKDFSSALKLEPSNQSLMLALLLSRGILHERLKNYNEAVADYKRLLELDPGNGAAQKNLDELYKTMREAGIDVGAEAEKIHKARMAQLMEEMKGRPVDDRVEYGLGLAKALSTPDVPQDMLDIFSVLVVDPETKVRVHILRALGNTGNKTFVPLIEPALKDRDPLVRACAAFSMAKTVGKPCTPQIIPLLADENAYVREEANRVLILVTGATFGPSKDKWTAWWNENKGQ